MNLATKVFRHFSTLMITLFIIFAIVVKVFMIPSLEDRIQILRDTPIAKQAIANELLDKYGIEVEFLDSYGNITGSGMGQAYNRVIVFEVQCEDVIFEARGWVHTDRDTGETAVQIAENYEHPDWDISVWLMGGLT